MIKFVLLAICMMNICVYSVNRRSSVLRAVHNAHNRQLFGEWIQIGDYPVNPLDANGEYKIAQLSLLSGKSSN